MPRISSPRPLDLTKPFVTSSQSYGSQPFDLSESLVTWYRDIQGDFVPDLSRRGNRARCGGIKSNGRVTGSNDIPEYNPLNYPIKSFDLRSNDTSPNVQHIRSINDSGTATSYEDHTFTDGTRDIPFSVSFWLKSSDTSGVQYLAAKGAIFGTSYEWEIQAGTTLKLRLWSGGAPVYYIQASTPLLPDVWNHFVITYDGSETQNGINIYKDGANAVPTRTLNAPYAGMQNSNLGLCIGTAFSSLSYAVSTNDLRGKIHSFAIWKNRVISLSEASSLYYAYINGPGGEARSGFISRSPRLLLQELDDHAGSYSTVQRTGDTSRHGTLVTNFDDDSTIIFSETGNPVFPAMLPRGNEFNSQAVDILGQESDISITAPIRSAQHPTYLHYSPEEQMGPFNENRVMPATDFFLSGTNPDVMPGFTSPLRSKVSIEIDITPQTEFTLTRNVNARNTAESQPASADNTGFAYFNFDQNKWSQIGNIDPATGDLIYYDYDINSAGFPDALTASFISQFSISPCVSFAQDSEKNKLGYSKIGSPISAFGAPSNTIFHATSSQSIKLSDYISDPFLLEAIKIEFGEVKAQRIQGDTFTPSQINSDNIDTGYQYLYQSGAIKDIDNYVFFAYRQQRNNRIVDSLSDVSSSERYLIFSGSMTFWNSASFESSDLLFTSQTSNKGLTHSPAFQYEFGLPYSSSLDTRLFDWDPSHDTYYFGGASYSLTSYAIAHFNFETSAVDGETTIDKTGLGHIATVDHNVSYIANSESDYHPGAFNDMYEAGAYISNRGYLLCGYPGAPGSPPLRINHSSDLQLTHGVSKSIAMWIWPDDTTPSSQQCILSKTSGTSDNVEYAAFLETDGKLTWRVYRSSATGANGYAQVTTTTGLNDESTWNHVAFSYTGGGIVPLALKIYLNGNLMVTTTSNIAPTAPTTSFLNNSYDVWVGSYGSGITNFFGLIGSLEFYSKSFTAADARNHYLLQSTSLLNPIDVGVGQFTGSIELNLLPAVTNRQAFGVSGYHSCLLQNAWIGGTSAERFFIDDWRQGISASANPFVIGEDIAGDGGIMLEPSIFSPKFDSRAVRPLGLDTNNLANLETLIASQIKLRNDSTSQGTVSPYLLFPNDELVFGIDAGLPSVQQIDLGYLSNITGSHLVIGAKPCKVTLIGSMISNQKEAPSSLNQNLSSNSVHEIIGAEPVLDQFQIEPISSYHGSYLDEIVTGSMATPSANTTLFTIFDQDNSRRIISRVSLGQAGTTGSLQRFVKMIDQTERTYDSCLPDFNVMLPSATKTASEYSYISENVPLFTGVDWEQEKDLPESIVLQFPFASNPTRNKQKTIGIVGATFTDEDDVESTTYIASSPVDITDRELDDMNILYKTRYEYVSYAASNYAYRINQTFYTFETTRPINITDGLVSYYRLKAISPVPAVVAALEDSVYSNYLTGTPTDGNSVTHTGPVYNKGSPLFPAAALSPGKLAYSSFIIAAASTNVRYFEDAGDYADHKMVNNVSSPTTDVPFSLSCVFYLENLGTIQTLIERRNTTAREYTLEVTAANYLKFYKGRGNTTTDFRSVLANATLADLAQDAWYHVVATYNGVDSNSNENVKIYINGVLQTTKILSHTGSPAIMNTSSSSKLRLGTGMKAGVPPGIIPDQATEITAGRIFSVGVWKNKELSAQDANDLYQAELVGSCVGNVRHRVGAVDSFIGKAPAFRYGISNIDPEFSSARWNASSFGQPRDMLESRLGITTSDGAPPVKIHFVSGSTYNADPNNTHTQNISMFATSSIPWIDDGLFRNREDNPDETLLII